MQIILIDILLHGILYYAFKILEFVLLSPIAIIGLIIEYSRCLFVKLKRKFRRRQVSNSPRMIRKELSPKKMFTEDNRPPYQVIVSVSELLLKEKPLD